MKHSLRSQEGGAWRWFLLHNAWSGAHRPKALATVQPGREHWQIFWQYHAVMHGSSCDVRSDAVNAGAQYLDANKIAVKVELQKAGVRFVQLLDTTLQNQLPNRE